MNKIEIIWQVIAFILPILSYVIGKKRNLIRVPKPVAALLANRDVMRLIIDGIQAAGSLGQKSNEERREHVAKWARAELYKQLGEWLPDSTINYLIEHAIVKLKTR